MRKLLLTGVCIAMLGASGSATAATGLKSVQGSDYTQDLSTGREVMACDMEADSHKVRGDYTPGGTSAIYVIYDEDGAKNSCAHTGIYSRMVYRHRAVEIDPVGNDPAGAWMYPS